MNKYQFSKEKNAKEKEAFQALIFSFLVLEIEFHDNICWPLTFIKGMKINSPNYNWIRVI